VQAKYGADGGMIELRARRVGEEIEIIVGDNGRGIPPDAIERSFEPDYTLKAGGTGLGLAVVRQAVAAHDGHVRARSATGGGAEFVVRLPLRDGRPADRTSADRCGTSRTRAWGAPSTWETA